MSEKSYLLAIDNGTQSVRALLFDLDGNLVGKGKEGTGKVTDNERLEAEGRMEQSEADLKQAGEKAKDAFRN